MKYDYLIVGSGLFGSVFTHEARKKGKRCIVIDKNNHIGGQVYTENIEGINVHKYGPHIFHTNNTEVWEYINQFSKFNNFINSPLANYNDEIYNLPFNMNTFNKMWGIITPGQAKEKIEVQKKHYSKQVPSNLEEQAIKLVGSDIYAKLIKGYTKKQWGKEPKDLPTFIIKRLPVRFTYDNNYFNDKYQGIPIGGYTKIVEKLLDGTEVRLNKNFFNNREYYEGIASKIVYTGMIDEFFNYQYGKLEYRSLSFEHQIQDVENFQGNAVINYTSEKIPYTRIIEHKHFESEIKIKKTVITKEYPKDWKVGTIPYYPINDDKNNTIYNMYRKLALNESNVIFGGRLSEYKYYDMDKVIDKALLYAKQELDN